MLVNVSRDCCILYSYITSDFCRYMSWHGDAKFSREFCMGIPNSLEEFAWGCQILCLVGDTKNTEGVPKSLGDFSRGCRCYKEVYVRRDNIPSDQSFPDPL